MLEVEVRHYVTVSLELRGDLGFQVGVGRDRAAVLTMNSEGVDVLIPRCGEDCSCTLLKTKSFISMEYSPEDLGARRISDDRLGVVPTAAVQPQA